MPVNSGAEDILRELSQTAATPDMLERRLDLCRRALRRIRRQGQPQLWAQLHSEMGLCFARLPHGDRATQLKQAIGHFEQALEVYTQQDYPDGWGATRHNLAKLHYDAARCYAPQVEAAGADAQERAIRHYQSALGIWTPDGSPRQWAQAQHALGVAWLYRIQGNQRENLEQAIACLEAALTTRTLDPCSAERAETLHDLGVAYIERYQDNRAQNLERAIELLGAALAVPQHAGHPAKWAKTRSNLGSAYLQRIRGERLDNLEQAIQYYREARAVQETVGPAEELAATNHNLGIAYAERLLGDKKANLEQTIAHLEQALKGFPENTFRWAIVQNDLADAHWRLGTYLRQAGAEAAAEHFEPAICHARAAARVYHRHGFARKWALAQHNLGNIYCDRLKGDRAQNLEDGIAFYRAALKVRTQEAYPFEWAQTQNNLGTAYWERAHGDRAKNLDRAARCFQDALTIHQPPDFPVDARRAARNLGNLHFEAGHWSAAHQAYDTALQAAEILYQASYSPAGKEAQLAENTELYERLVQACLQELDYASALAAAEGSKARTFLDQMGQGAFPPPPDLSRDLLRRELDLIEGLRGQEQALANLAGRGLRAGEEQAPSAVRDVVGQRRQLRDELEAVWEEMSRQCPAARNYVAARRGEPMKWDNLRALAERLGPSAALVEFYTLPDEVVVFVLRAGWQAPYVHRASLNQGRLQHHVNSFYREVAEHRSYPALNQTWQHMAGPLLGDVLPHLENVQLLYCIPHGLLHHIPLHALEVDGAPLIERFAVAYAPSAAVLARVLEQTGQEAANGPRSALVVGNPTEDLPFAETEAQVVAQHFGVTPYLGREATKKRLLGEIEKRRNVHLACHGDFHSLEPLRSCLLLHDASLTAQEILKLRLSAELLVLSACQTARQTVTRGDELMGLLRVLLYAGAPSLVVSLWSVDDRSTGELMRRFYTTLHQTGSSPFPNRAEVLRRAMLEIRRQPGWEHPYFWAPFILVGGVQIAMMSREEVTR